MKPIVSVIITTFDRKELLAQAIKSVLSQTLENFELIIVDDGSFDGTQEMVQEFCKADSRVEYTRQENSGTSVARNNGVTRAHADYIAFLDDDDLWFPNKLAKQIAFVRKHPECDVFCSGSHIQKNGNIIGYLPRIKPHKDICLKDLLKESCVNLGVSIFKRKSFLEVGGFDTNWDLQEDVELCFRMIRKYTFKFDPEPLGIYRIHGDSKSKFTKSSKVSQISKIVERANNSFRIIQRSSKENLSITEHIAVYRTKAHMHYRLGQSYLDAHDWGSACKQFFIAIISDPLVGLYGRDDSEKKIWQPFINPYYLFASHAFALLRGKGVSANA